MHIVNTHSICIVILQILSAKYRIKIQQQNNCFKSEICFLPPAATKRLSASHLHIALRGFNWSQNFAMEAIPTGLGQKLIQMMTLTGWLMRHGDVFKNIVLWCFYWVKTFLKKCLCKDKIVVSMQDFIATTSEKIWFCGRRFVLHELYLIKDSILGMFVYRNK